MYMAYICILWEVFVHVSQLLAAVTHSVLSLRDPGYFLSQGRQQEEQTYLPPPVGLPTGASPRTTGLLCPRPRQMTAVLLFYFGLVLINTGYLPLLGPPTTTHRTLKREGERSGDGCWVETERKVGHVSQLKIIALNVYT